ncbi:MAG: tetraacyldisaccharide 4'-kinase [Bacteroidales bacterium]|nr:tetraacyldisaccharide 4'-kinase [Bacteroidales bacterium]
MKLLLYPLSIIYSIVLFIRHKLFDYNIIKSRSFDVPTICVGNLSFGGTGKTPHTEYLIRLLSDSMRVAVLSRGYGRKTRGFVMAHEGVTHEDIGDEPMQYFTKFPGITVAVDEKRGEGVRMLMEMDEKPDVILLDDAYQHRSIKAGLNILLTDYHNIYSKDTLTPAGNLRDIKHAARRADIIIVTKCPAVLDPYSKRNIIESLRPKSHQKVLFSKIIFDELTPVNEAARTVNVSENRSILLFCGIANPYPLEDYMNRKTNSLTIMHFNDHHEYSDNDFDEITGNFEKIIGKKKIAVTTEKDFMRMADNSYLCNLENMPLFTIPIKVRFHDDNEEIFNKEIFDYVGLRKDS